MVQTAEHLLATLYAFGIDRAAVHLSGPEVPGLDGSSAVWVERIGEAGTVAAATPRRIGRVRSALAVTGGAAALVAAPNRGGLVIDYTLDHDADEIPIQRVSFAVTPETFAREIAPCRTFVLEREAAGLLAAGLGKGATRQNTLVVGARGVEGTTLRFPDEFARHKVLDLLGDLALVGAWLEARIVGLRSGHTLNAALACRIAEHLGEAAPGGG
jgi:UDP-3-O-acyl-N-acetylglucosamine deacetylase